MPTLAYVHIPIQLTETCANYHSVSGVKPAGTATLAPASLCQAPGSSSVPASSGSTSVYVVLGVPSPVLPRPLLLVGVNVDFSTSCPTNLSAVK